jgi:hypothetical protein
MRHFEGGGIGGANFDQWSKVSCFEPVFWFAGTAGHVLSPLAPSKHQTCSIVCPVGESSVSAGSQGDNATGWTRTQVVPEEARKSKGTF